MAIAARNVLRISAVGLCCALVACAGRTTPPPGGPGGSKPEKARKEAEALVLGAVGGAATAQAQAAPDAAVKREFRLLGHAVALTHANGVRINAPRPPEPAPVPPAAPTAPVPPLDPPAAARDRARPKLPPRPGSGPLVVSERVGSAVPYPTEAEAEADALEQARERIDAKLAGLDPPVRYKVTANEVRREFARADSRTVRSPDPADPTEVELARLSGGQKLVYVEYELQVTAEQVRELRAQERVSAGLRLLGVLAAAALAGFLFLRADARTGGSLTSWLALAAVALAGGAAAVFVFV